MKKIIKSILLLILFTIFNQIKPNIIQISKWKYPNSNVNILIFHDVHKIKNIESEVLRYKEILENLSNLNGKKTILVENTSHDSKYLNSYKKIISINNRLQEKILIKTIKKKNKISNPISLLTFFNLKNNPLEVFDILNIEKPTINKSNFNIQNIEIRQLINFIYGWTIPHYILHCLEQHIKGIKTTENPIQTIINILTDIGFKEDQIKKIEKLLKEIGEQTWSIFTSSQNKKHFDEIENLFNKEFFQILENPENRNFIIDFFYNPIENILETYIQESFTEKEKTIYVTLLGEIKKEKEKFLEQQKLPRNPSNFYKLAKTVEINALREILLTLREKTEEQKTIAIFMGSTHSFSLEEYLIKLGFNKITSVGIYKNALKLITSTTNQLDTLTENTNFNMEDFFELKTFRNFIQNNINLNTRYLISLDEIKYIFNPNKYELNQLNTVNSFGNIDYLITKELCIYPNIAWAINTQTNKFEIVTYNDFDPLHSMHNIFPEMAIEHVIKKYKTNNDFINDVINPLKEEIMAIKRQARKRKHPIKPAQRSKRT